MANPVTEPTVSRPANAASSRVHIVDEAILGRMEKPGRLFCTVDTGFISLAIADAGRNKFFAFEVFPFPKPPGEAQLAQAIKDLSTESTLLRKVDFRYVSVQVTNTAFTFIPEALFRSEDASGYYYFNHQQRQDEQVLSNEVKSIGAVTIFSVQGVLLAALKHLFENFSIHHHLTAFLESVRYAGRGTSDRSVFIHLHSTLMDVVVMSERKLLFANSYAYKSAEDAAYYLLMVLNQLSVNPEKSEVTLTGEVDPGSSVPEQFRNIISHFDFGQRTKGAEFSYGFDTLPPHYYHLPFSHILCAS